MENNLDPGHRNAIIPVAGDSGCVEAVSHRLVALAKEQSSQDNISVVVVFLADPAEVARRGPMEAAAPSPFVNVNGADMYCGGPTNGQHAGLDDIEDFGPETDVDMVDDVLLSPAIAAAKALVQGKQELDDDLELQRQQLSDFDDPADLEPSRDTPTPPVHEATSYNSGPLTLYRGVSRPGSSPRLASEPPPPSRVKGEESVGRRDVMRCHAAR
ncbi:hypothetical protein J6590_054384 [Homalodisca vitripennis]|nr:hypothetical protein J6590_054384 [Homalodisca vitripennis]